MSQQLQKLQVLPKIQHSFQIQERARKLLAEAGWKPNAEGILEKDGKPFQFSILDRDKKTEKYFINRRPSGQKTKPAPSF